MKSRCGSFSKATICAAAVGGIPMTSIVGLSLNSMTRGTSICLGKSCVNAIVSSPCRLCVPTRGFGKRSRLIIEMTGSVTGQVTCVSGGKIS